MSIKRFKEIIGGTEDDVNAKFPWLNDADIANAIVDITGSLLVWKYGVWKDGLWEDGVWEDGVWEGGVWEYGLWEDGVWKGGVWKGGVWEGGVWEGGLWKGGVWECGLWEGGVWKGGQMWCNISQDYVSVTQINGKFQRIMRKCDEKI